MGDLVCIKIVSSLGSLANFCSTGPPGPAGSSGSKGERGESGLQVNLLLNSKRRKTGGIRLCVMWRQRVFEI